MNRFVVLFVLVPFGLTLGYIKFKSLEAELKNKWHKFIEFWNDFANYFIAAFIGYYFLDTFWPSLSGGRGLNNLHGSDFILLIVFLLGIFGHLCVMSNNITEGIRAIIKRVLR